jgi:beta-lactamase regulating signal transducer with metallopeptidase domain/HEAT repeat protein
MMPTPISDLVSDSPVALPMLVALVKVTGILLAALGVSRAMSRASAGGRHLVWFVALGAAVLVPALTVWGPLPVRLLPESFVPAAAQASARRDALREPGDRAAAQASAEPAPTITSPALPRVPLAASRWPGPGTTLLFVWSMVALALVARLGHGAYAVRRIVRRARPLEHPDWQAPLYEIADRLGLDAAPRLLRSEDVSMPFAAGLAAPTIVLPAASDEWTADRRSAVLIHELGHIRRRDLVGHTLARIACALYWFHPLVWTAARRLRAESERACDDLTLNFGTRPSDYAEHLLDIVTRVRGRATPSMALAMAHRKEFEGRMLAILDPELRRRAPSRVQVAALVGTLSALTLLVGAAVPAPRTVQAPEVRALRVAVAASPADTSRARSTRPSIAPDEPVVAVRVGQEANPARAIPAPAARPATAARSSSQPDDDRAALLAKMLRTDASAPVRRVAAWGLQKYAEDEVALEALVAAAASDADASVREMSAWALADARERSAAVPTLMKAARQDRDPHVRATAVWALGSIGDGTAVETLVGILADSDAALREMAAWSIGSCHPDRAPAALIGALSDRERDVRASVAWALYTIGDPGAAGALDAALRRETDAEVQHGLIRALGATGEASVAALERLVTSPDSEIRGIAVAALAGGEASGPWPWPRPEPRPFP